jgi:glucose-1-phosphate thymidylyltransferase
MPVYDKPLIYYPLSTLMLAGITNILVITTPQDLPRYEQLLGDGHRWGIDIGYAVQPSPDGLAQAFIIGRDFIGKDGCALILGDNIFYGHGLVDRLTAAAARDDGATVFAYWVKDPHRYGVVEFDAAGQAVAIEEKPPAALKLRRHRPLLLRHAVVDIAAGLKPSARGELEITDVNSPLPPSGQLRVENSARATPGSIPHPRIPPPGGHYVETVRKTGTDDRLPEEIAYGWGSSTESSSSAGRASQEKQLRPIPPQPGRKRRTRLTGGR